MSLISLALPSASSTFVHFASGRAERHRVLLLFFFLPSFSLFLFGLLGLSPGSTGIHPSTVMAVSWESLLDVVSWVVAVVVVVVVAVVRFMRRLGRCERRGARHVAVDGATRRCRLTGGNRPAKKKKKKKKRKKNQKKSGK